MTWYDPETVYSSLWAQASTASGFVTMSRHLQHWTATPFQPALFQVQPDDGMIYIWRPNNDPKITFFAHFYIYTKNNDPRGTPSMNLNAALASLFAALETPAAVAYASDGRNTLGGLVYDCRINGKILTVEGVGTDLAQSLAIVPVEILVTH